MTATRWDTNTFQDFIINTFNMLQIPAARPVHEKGPCCDGSDTGFSCVLCGAKIHGYACQGSEDFWSNYFIRMHKVCP